MPVLALTIDFWNTLVQAQTNGAPRTARRMNCLIEAVGACGYDPGADRIEAAYGEAVRRFDRTWKELHTTPPTSDLVRCIWEVLALEIDTARHDETVRIFEESLLHHPPDFVDGVEEALAWAAERYPLSLISDTMFSPGRVIRRVLEARGLLPYFDAFVFSDETGFSKPDHRAFEAAASLVGVDVRNTAHIGDLRRTDVAGARAVGARAILFAGAAVDPDPYPIPDAILPGWPQLPEVLASLG